MFSQILVKIGQIVKSWQQFFEIQDGGGRHHDIDDALPRLLVIMYFVLRVAGNIVHVQLSTRNIKIELL